MAEVLPFSQTINEVRPATLPVTISRAAAELGALRVIATVAMASSPIAMRSMPFSISSSCCVPAPRIKGRCIGCGRAACASAAMDAVGHTACDITDKATKAGRSSRDEAFAGLRVTKVDCSRGM